jgi:hypothetical protein
MNQTTTAQPPRSAWPGTRFVLLGGLVVLAVVGFTLVPPGPPRAVLCLPAVLWVPGRGLLGVLGLTGSARRWRTPLAVLLSLIILITAGLATNLVIGSVPLRFLPVAVAVVFLPLHLLERDPSADVPLAEFGRQARFGAVFATGALAVGALLWLVSSALPAPLATQPYLEFALAGQYASVTGPVPVTAGAVLRIPVEVTAAGGQNIIGLSVATTINGAPAAGVPARPVTGSDSQHGAAEITVTAPGGCVDQVALALRRGDTDVRTVNLYLTTENKSCAHR